MINCIFIRNNSKQKRKSEIWGFILRNQSTKWKMTERSNWAEGRKIISNIRWHSEDYFRRVEVRRGKKKLGALIKVQTRDSELGQKGTQESQRFALSPAHLQSSVNVCTSNATRCHCQNDPWRTHSSRELWTQSLYLQCQDISGSLFTETSWVPLCKILKQLHLP